MTKTILSEEARERLRLLVELVGEKAAAEGLGVSRLTIVRAMTTRPMRRATTEVLERGLMAPRDGQGSPTAQTGT